MDTIKQTDRKGLRGFGLTAGLIVAVLFGLILPWKRHSAIPAVPWLVAAALWLLAITMPLKLRGVYVVWMRFGSVLGRINTRIVLGILFYGMITPLGLLMRLVRRDPLNRALDSTAASYRKPAQAGSAMEVPF